MCCARERKREIWVSQWEWILFTNERKGSSWFETEGYTDGQMEVRESHGSIIKHQGFFGNSNTFLLSSSSLIKQPSHKQNTQKRLDDKHEWDTHTPHGHIPII